VHYSPDIAPFQARIPPKFISSLATAGQPKMRQIGVPYLLGSNGGIFSEIVNLVRLKSATEDLKLLCEIGIG
jgi:hypothetical protein